MHRRFRSKAKLGAVAAVSVALGGLLSSGLLSASAQTGPAPSSPDAYTGLFKNAGEPQAADAALLAKAQRENPSYELELRPATQLPAAVDGVRAFAVRSTKGPACLVMQFTPMAGAPVGGGYGVACPSEGSGAIDFISPGGSFGVVPDEVTTVSYTFAGGETRSGKVIDNVWQAPLDATGVSFTENGAGRAIDLMPASALTKEEKYYGGGLIASRNWDPSAEQEP
jgi:hypothetical protein